MIRLRASIVEATKGSTSTISWAETGTPKVGFSIHRHSMPARSVETVILPSIDPITGNPL